MNICTILLSSFLISTAMADMRSPTGGEELSGPAAPVRASSIRSITLPGDVDGGPASPSSLAVYLAGAATTENALRAMWMNQTIGMTPPNYLEGLEELPPVGARVARPDPLAGMTTVSGTGVVGYHGAAMNLTAPDEKAALKVVGTTGADGVADLRVIDAFPLYTPAAAPAPASEDRYPVRMGCIQ